MWGRAPGQPQPEVIRRSIVLVALARIKMAKNCGSAKAVRWIEPRTLDQRLARGAVLAEAKMAVPPGQERLKE